MQYLLTLTDQDNQYMVLFTLREIDTKRLAGDFIFDVVGAESNQLIESEMISESQAEDLTAIQEQLFAHDSQGPYIKDAVMLFANGQELNPDQPMIAAFAAADRSGIKYMRCDMVVSTSGLAPRAGTDIDPKQAEVGTFARIMFIHQIGVGYLIDVTHELPELSESIAEAEKNGWIEIDIQKAAYKLTVNGTKLHQSYIDEAQDLIRRYDIYGDVSIGSDGNISFDTGFGEDLRIPMFELNQINPFRARFLIGLNDGEWNLLEDWCKWYKQPVWYERILADVGRAPAIDEVGRDVLLRVFDRGREALQKGGN